jgi:hypothetical protein
MAGRYVQRRDPAVGEAFATLDRHPTVTEADEAETVETESDE